MMAATVYIREEMAGIISQMASRIKVWHSEVTCQENLVRMEFNNNIGYKIFIANIEAHKIAQCTDQARRHNRDSTHLHLHIPRKKCNRSLNWNAKLLDTAAIIAGIEPRSHDHETSADNCAEVLEYSLYSQVVINTLIIP